MSIDSVVTDALRASQGVGNSEDSEVDKLRVVWPGGRSIFLTKASFGFVSN